MQAQTLYYPSLKVKSVRFFNKELGVMDCHWIPDLLPQVRLEPGDTRLSIMGRKGRITVKR